MISAHEIVDAAASLLAEGEAAWLVGGAVRDLVSHRLVEDVNLVVDGDCGRLAAALAGRLGGSVYEHSERFSTWRVVLESGRIDLAPVRGESLENDLRTRDFTVDAMARSVGGGELIDPLGGLGDLRDGLLRPCSPGALRADPARVLRLARLSETLGLKPDEGVEEAARAAAGGLAQVAGERVEHELSALLEPPAATRAVRRLDDLGALEVVLPELTDCRDVSQNPYHHLDVFDHTLEALECLPGIVVQLGGEKYLASPDQAGLPDVHPLVPLSYATLLHDVGKFEARHVGSEGRVTFYRHDEIGARKVAAIARRLRTSRRFEQYLVHLVRHHLRLGFLVREMPLTRRALVRYRRAVEPFAFEANALSLADRMATRGDLNPPESLARHFRIAREVFGDAPAPPRRLLSGDEVKGLLGLEEGPDIGVAIDTLQEEIDCGEVTDADGARVFLRTWWRERAEDAGGGTS